MDSKRWHTAREVFEEARDLSELARSRFVDQACGDDLILKAAVRRLLEVDAEAEGFLSEPLFRALAPNSFFPPDHIGPYRLREKLGEGGMGVVYRAVRDDGAFQRDVAVKLILHHPIEEESRRRLGIERQILAGLDHPWIAQIFDGGTTDNGLPYMVMEYIEGEPIDAYCERRELTIPERIGLFRKVCAAVHCSHQNLVVHCDLKPSNILVTPTGEPKLLDFGIAKLLSPPANSINDPPTTVGNRPLTPEYASPEQHRGEALSTVSDVYSLGVLLYKLITGLRPKTPSRLSTGKGLHDDVVPPSVAARQSKPDASNRLRGDLDAIVLKALRAEPSERFGSVEQLSDDLGRHLEGFPVVARQGNLRYKALKFLRRHQVSVTAAIVSVTALSIFAFSMASLAGRLAQEKERSQEIVGFFRLFFERASPIVGQGNDLTLRDAVDLNAKMLENGLKDQPGVKVEIATVLGDIYRELGQGEQALDWSLRALELNQQLAGEGSQAHSLSLIQVGAALRDLGRFEDSEAQTRAGLEQLQAQSNLEPSVLVHSLNHLVELLCFQHRFEEADAHSWRALRLARDHLGDQTLEILVATANRGQVSRGLGRNDEALQLYKSSLNLYRQRFSDAHPHVATVLGNLAVIYLDRGDLSLAHETFEEVDRQYLELFGWDHHGRVRPLVGLAQLAIQNEENDKALAYYRDAITISGASDLSGHLILLTAKSLAEFLLEVDRCHEGEALLRHSLEFDQPRAARNWRHAELEGLLGECLARQENPIEARSLLERSYENLKAHAQIVDPNALRLALERLITFYGQLGEEKSRERALAALQALDLGVEK